MQNIEIKIIAAQESVNRCRNEITTPGVGGYRKVIGHREPGDIGYLPPITDFVTIEFNHGFVTMPVEEFNKLTKVKKNKLMRSK